MSSKKPEFRNTKKSKQKLPKSFYGQVDASGGSKRSQSGTSVGGGASGKVGFRKGDFSIEASGDTGGSIFLPSDALKKFGVKNQYDLSKPALRKIEAGIKDVFNLGRDDKLSISYTPDDDGIMFNYGIRF